VFGARLDDDAFGVTVDALGINGAKATTLLASNADHFREELVHSAPTLVILAYGTNEAGDTTTSSEDHVTALRSLVERVKIPSAACLLLGPPDRGAHTLPKLLTLIEVQRTVAADVGCAFYNQFVAMGGVDSMGRWANEPPPRRAQRDFVHLTRSGYALVNEALAHDLLAAYDAWKAKP
jgi:lysophospholipase L1-like esterase